jgi:hypothetical protein
MGMLREKLSRLRTRFSREDWNLGVISQSAEDIVRNGITRPVRWLPRLAYWDYLADPSCLVQPDGTRILFAEHLNHWVSRGEIWAACVPASEDFASAVFRPWMRSSRHLSYPFPFRDENGTSFFTVETGESGALYLWRATGDGYQRLGPIIDSPVIDPTPWHDGTRWWMFCTLRNDRPNEKLYLFHAASLQGPWTPHSANPVKRDKGSSRPAGPLFRVDGKLIRPAQDCTRTYGGAVVLHEIVRLDPDGFDEVQLRRLEPDPVYPDGLHTFCPAGNETIIDSKRWAFEAMDLPRKLFSVVQNRTRPLRKIVLPSHLMQPGRVGEQSQ